VGRDGSDVKQCLMLGVCILSIVAVPTSMTSRRICTSTTKQGYTDDVADFSISTMGRQQVYGKRSRAAFDPRAAAAFSSPEHPVPKPTKTDVVKPVAAKKIVLDEPAQEKARDEVKKVDKKGRCALGERNANAVVRPVEIVVPCTPKKTKATPKKTRSTPKRTDCAPKKTDCTPKKTKATSKKNREPAAQQEDSELEPQILAIVDDKACLVVDKDTNEDAEVVVEVKKKSKSNSRRRGEAEQDGIAGTDAEALKQAKLKRREAKAAKKERLRTAEEQARQDQLPSTSDDVIQIPEEKLQQSPSLDLSDPYESHCSSLLHLSSHPLTPFSSWSTDISEHFTVTKIAEASFGEVYRLSLKITLPDFDKSEESVFKVIALRPPESTFPKGKKRNAALKKAEMMSAPLDVANEVKLLQRMSSIPGFTNFRDLRILQGRPPEAFIEAFHAFNAVQEAKGKDLSHFPDPSRKANYAADQLWAIIEMQDAGTDLEQLVEVGNCAPIWDVWDVFWQVVLSLAKGEEGAEFEHRDLHLGNICVNRRRGDEQMDVDVTKKLGFTGIETTIIDYTISRCQMQDDSIAFLDLDRDSSLFEGDSTEEYQYDIYRYMRGVMYLDSAYSFPTEEDVKESGRSWEQFHPQTNLVWLHLVLYKLLEQMQWPSSKRAPAKRMKEKHKLWKRACDLEYVLSKVQELLDPGVICENEIRSARDLVLLAIEEQWLDCMDVIGQGVEDDEELARQMDALEV
jgi:serine/threonine-protein kinase haspin